MAQYSNYYPAGLGPWPVPAPWQTTWVSKHYPEHHHPFEHTRHSISRALDEIAHDLTHAGPAEPALINPRIDIREVHDHFLPRR